MNEQEKNRWYRVPEVWMILVMLGGMVVGSFWLLYQAVIHSDPSVEAPTPIATPLPPSSPHTASHTRPADSTTP
jgi:zona occludens toxin (predicted ATPase)